MTTGKNKLMRFSRLYFGGYDLSGDARTFGALENQMGAVVTTGISDDVENALSDKRRVVGVMGFQTLLNDDAGGAYTILGGAPQNFVTSVFIGGGAAPAAGDMAYLLPAVQLSSETEFSQGIGALATDFKLNAGSVDAYVDNPFGIVLIPKTAITITTTGSTIDGGAASSGNGGRANLHIFVSSGGTWAFTVEHSTNGSAWSTLLTFVLTGNAVGAEHKTVSGIINQYRRILATRTSGTCTIACSLAVN